MTCRSRRCPARILIPVANPRTAEELIRLGAAMLDPRTGELSALGHRRGPRGDAAVRGRDPRPPRPPAAPAGPRLRPRRDDDPPDRADRPARRRGHHRGVGRAGGGPHHLRLGRQGADRPRRQAGPTVFSPTIDEVVRESPCDIAVVKQRGSREIKRVLVPVRGGPHAELALRYADAIARHHDATVVVLHLVPPGITLAVRAQAERALAAFIKQHLQGKGEAAPARGAQRPQRDPARGREGRPRRHGRVGAAGRRRRRDVPVRRAARGDRRARQADASSSSRPASGIERATFEQLASRAETLAAADRAAEEARAVPARVERWFGESNFHHAEFARPAAPGRRSRRSRA